MKNFSSEIKFKTSRSSGAGGQNVNKVETSVTSVWNVRESQFFSEQEKEMIFFKLKNIINSEGLLQLTSSEARTQLANKKIAIEKTLLRVEKSLLIPKYRYKTKPSKNQIQKRIDNKKKLSEKKSDRKFKF